MGREKNAGELRGIETRHYAATMVKTMSKKEFQDFLCLNAGWEDKSEHPKSGKVRAVHWALCEPPRFNQELLSAVDTESMIDKVRNVRAVLQSNHFDYRPYNDVSFLLGLTLIIVDIVERDPTA